MLLRKRTILAIAFAGAFTGVSAMAGHGMTMKPLQGVSFDIGTKRAVSYFLSDNGACKLTLTLALRPGRRGLRSPPENSGLM
jgi:hypothetical protein